MRLSGFYNNSCTNGEGWRSVLFLTGCPHKCIGCQNPETWDFDGGHDYDIDDLINQILENKEFISGITLSGGEPFQERNVPSLIKIIKAIKKRGLNVWCYTGYTYEYLIGHKKFAPMLKEIDVLVDGPFIKDQQCSSLRFKGSKNQRIIDVKASIEANHPSMLM